MLKNCFEHERMETQAGIRNMASQVDDPVTYKPYYPIGNTRPFDVTLGCRVARECDMLLLGCGDIRNILYTTHVLQQNGTLRSSSQVLNFHLNDNESGIITRDLILFNIVKTVNPDDEDDMKFLWSVWYDLLMPKDHLDRLFGLMTNLTKYKSGEKDIHFANDETEQSVKNCLAGWSKIQHSADEVTELKQRYLIEKYKNHCVHFPDQRAVSQIADNSLGSKDERLKDRFTQEVREYTDTGTTRINATNISEKQILATFCVNETFFPPGNRGWTVPDDSSPFLCFDVERDIERYDGEKTYMAKICLEILTEWVRSFQAADKNCRLKIYLWLDDAKSLCEKTLPEHLTFDFIDTSNLTDEIGLIPLLMYCQKKLREDSGVLRTETFDWYLCMSHGEHFLRLCVDISPLMYPTILGLHMAEDLNIGQECRADCGTFEGGNKLVFRWRNAATFTPITLTGEDGISICLQTVKSPEPLQSADVFQNIKPALLDDYTKEKIAERLKKMTVDQKSTSMSAGTNEPENEEVVVEYNDRYEVTIYIPGIDSPCDLNVTHDGTDKRTIILQMATDRATHFSTTLRFSCPVILQTGRNTQSKTTGLIHRTFLKDQGVTVGERVLPWKKLKTKEASSLPDYPTSEFSMRVLRTRLGWVFPQNKKAPAVEKDSPYPLHQLRRVLAFLVLFGPIDFRTRVFFVPRRKPLGMGRVEHFQSIIVTNGFKLWEQMPATFVTVYDHDAVLRLIREGKMTMFDYMRDTGNLGKFLVLDDEYLQGYDILSRILQVNSYRLSQDSVDSQWKMRSFIRFRYLLKTCINPWSERNMQARVLQAGVFKDPFVQFQCIQTFQESELLEMLSSPAARKVLETVMSTYKPVCDCCGKMTDCKKCTACERVFYCSRFCQKRAWPQHKLQCSK